MPHGYRAVPSPQVKPAGAAFFAAVRHAVVRCGKKSAGAAGADVRAVLRRTAPVSVRRAV